MTSAPASIATTRHTYGTDPEHFGELRLPAGAGPFPAIVYIHGGGYRSAVTLAGAAGICTALASEGYAVWSIEYRRIGNGGGWPMTFDDVTAAAQFLNTLADHLAIDLRRAIVGGQSAGGQLALWLANRSVGGHADLPRFRGVLALAPASDLQASARGGNGAIIELLGGSPDQVPERYTATSPVELAPIGVPQLVVHGTADNTVPYTMSQNYVETARQKGDEVELVTIEGADHLDLWNPGSAAFPHVVAAARPFLRRISTL